MKELNAFLEERGVSTHLKVKRSLAQAFGLPMDNGTEQQQSDLLRALKVGAMVITGEVTESFQVEVVSFDGKQSFSYDEPKDALAEVAKLKGENKMCRIVSVTTISHVN